MSTGGGGIEVFSFGKIDRFEFVARIRGKVKTFIVTEFAVLRARFRASNVSLLRPWTLCYHHSTQRQFEAVDIVVRIELEGSIGFAFGEELGYRVGGTKVVIVGEVRVL